MQFHYRYQVDDHNNRFHSTISLESTWDIKSWMYCNLAWYLVVTEVNTALASGKFQNDGNVMPDLYFWRKLVIHCIEILLEQIMGILVGLYGPVEGLKYYN